MTNTLRVAAAAAGLGVLLAGCTSGQIGVEPTTKVADVAGGTTLQFAVGTANFNGTIDLNTLVTYRQANGLSGTLYNTPAIQGPSGFAVPSASSAGTDAGTSAITGTAPTQPGTTAVATTFGQSGGAFAYGFAPENSSTSGTPFYPGLSLAAGGRGFGSAVGAVTDTYTQPVYGSSSSRRPFLLGPPAVPDFHNGTFPAGFAGYNSGFVAFQTAPVAGSYTLTVTVPGNTPGAAPVATKTATATLAGVTPLPVEPAPGFTSDGVGGGSFTVAAAPAGVTHQVLYIVDVNGNSGAQTFYSFNATNGGTFTLATANGPTDPTGAHTPPFATGDSVFAYVVGADYDVLGLAPPLNTQQAPALPAQADITVSPTFATTY